jgi:hypothetical protein
MACWVPPKETRMLFMGNAGPVVITAAARSSASIPAQSVRQHLVHLSIFQMKLGDQASVRIRRGHRPPPPPGTQVTERHVGTLRNGFTSNFHTAEPLTSRQSLIYSITSQHFMEHEAALPCSQKPATSLHLRPDESCSALTRLQNLFNKVKYSYLRNRPWRPIGL